MGKHSHPKSHPRGLRQARQAMGLGFWLLVAALVILIVTTGMGATTDFDWRYLEP
jgi:hypothetical protein